MKKSLTYALGIIVVATAAFTVSHTIAQTDGSVIRVAGTDSMFRRLQILTSEFTKINSTIKVNVVEGELLDMVYLN